MNWNNCLRQTLGRAAKGAMALAFGVLAAGTVWAQPANDNFDNATVVQGPSGAINGETVGATSETGEPMHGAAATSSVWYRWEAPLDGTLNVYLTDADFDAVIAAYSGADLMSLTQEAFNDVPAINNRNIFAFMSFIVTAGETYWFAVDTADGMTGMFTLDWALNANLNGGLAGTFAFTAPVYTVTENESFPSSLSQPVQPSSAFNIRDVDGALITVHRVGGTMGQVAIDYFTRFYLVTNTYDTNIVTTNGMVIETNMVTITNIVDSATPGLDYTAVSGTLIFDHHQVSTNFIVPVFSNGLEDGDRTFEVVLGHPYPVGGENPDQILPVTQAASRFASVNIVEVNEGTNTFSIEKAYYRVDEDGGSVDVDVLLTGEGGGEVTIEVVSGAPSYSFPLQPESDYADVTDKTYSDTIYTDGSPQQNNPADLVLASERLAFDMTQNRQRFTININDDNIKEFYEEFRVRLANPSDDRSINFGVGQVTILDDDQTAGALDRDWNPDFILTTDPPLNLSPGANGEVLAVAVQTDQKTLIGGDFTGFNGQPRNRIARINQDGSHDPSFNPGTGADGFISSIALYPDTSTNAGKILVGGGFSSFNNVQRNGVARLNPDGTLDATFNPGLGFDGVVRSVTLVTGGKVVVAGDFTTFNGTDRRGVARLNEDGSLDAAYNPGTGANGIVWSVAAASDPGTGSDKVYLGGEFTQFNGLPRSGVARLNANGSLDTTFNPGGGANGPVFTLAAQTDGKVIIAGSFDRYDFQDRPSIARLNGNGSLDMSFDPGNGPDNSVYAVTLQPDGKPLVGGVFTMFDGVPRYGYTRLYTNGVVDTSFNDSAYNHFSGLRNKVSYEPEDFVNAIAVETNGNVVIGGSFQLVGGHASIEAFDDSLIPDIRQTWSRQDKRARSNVARLIGNRTPGPGNLRFFFPEYGVDEGTGLATMRLQRIDGRLGTVGVNLELEDRVATGSDYFWLTRPIIWDEQFGDTVSAGDTRFLIVSFPVVDDSLVEGNEVLDMYLRDPFGSITLGGVQIPLGGARARYYAPMTIVDNDFDNGVFAFSEPEFIVNENETMAMVQVVRTNGSVGAVSVQYRTYAESAEDGLDYQGQQGTLTFASGQTNRTINIPIANDTLVEFDETFSVVLTNATGGATVFGGQPTSIVTSQVVIIDDDFAPGRLNFAMSDFEVFEDGGQATITVTRTGGNVGQVSAKVSATSGSATAGVDFQGVTNVVTFVHGDTTPKTVSITISNEVPSLVEGDETVNLTLFEPSILGALGMNDSATLTIRDDDAYGTFSFTQSTYQTDENGTMAIITVERLNGIAGTVMVDYRVAADSGGANPADPNTEFLPETGALTFSPGELAQSFPVTIYDDSVKETDETVLLELTGVSQGSLGAPSTATLVLVDDESFNIPAGSVDTTFNPSNGANNNIFDVAYQPNGRLIIGGAFTLFNGVSRNRVARLLANGSVDDTFNAGSGPNDQVRTLALQRDGRILLGGFFTSINGTNRNHIARLLPDGSVDTFFNPGGGADSPVLAMAVASDDRIVIGGAFASFNGISRRGVAMLNTNGTLHLPFNPGTGTDGDVQSVAIQRDGKILIAGDFDTVDGISRPGVARLLRDGTVDMSFNPGTGASDEVRVVQVTPEGRILLGGSFTQFNGLARNRIVQLLPDGSVDTSFLGGGDGANASVLDIALQLDGKILVAGDFTRFNDVTRSRLTRLNADGTTDPTINFGSGANAFIADVLVQPDRKIVVAGGFSQFNGQVRNRIARLHGGSIAGAGSIEFQRPFYTGREGDGTAPITVRRIGGTFGDVEVQFSTSPGSATEDVDYVGTNGVVVLPEGEVQATFQVQILDDNLVEPDESVLLILGVTGMDGLTLGPQPVATLSIVSDDTQLGFARASYSVSEGVPSGAAAIAVNRTGSLERAVSVNYSTVPGTATAGVDYVAGSGTLVFGAGVTQQTFIVTIQEDLVVEPTETLGLVLSNPGQGALLGLATASLSILDNDFLPGELSFATNNFLVLESSGQAQVTIVRTNGSTGELLLEYFTSPGTATEDIDYTAVAGSIGFDDGQTSQTVVIPIFDDPIVEGDEFFLFTVTNVVGGSAFAGSMVATVTIQDDEFGPGSLDRDFDPGEGANNFVRHVAVQSDGKVVLGGAFTSFNGVPVNYVARLESDGSLDTSFQVGAGANALVTGVEIQNDQKVLLGGSFSEFNGLSYSRVARLGVLGGVDLNYQQISAINGTVNGLALHTNDRAVVVGSFSLPTRGVIQLRSDGSVDTSFNPGSGANAPVHVAEALPSGKVLLGGAFSVFNGAPRSRVVRLNADGNVDGGFVPPEFVSGTVFDLAVAADGKVLVAGDFQLAGGLPQRGLARLEANGALDTSFDPGTGANDVVYAVEVLSNGKVALGGSFTRLNGVMRNRYALLLADGSLDTGFDPGIGADNTVYDIAVLAGDDLLLAGNFSEVSGVRREGIARVIGTSGGGGLVVSDVSVQAGQASITIASQAGVSYVLEGTEDFMVWQGIVTNQAVSTSLTLTDPNAGSFNLRFYRVRLHSP